MNVFLDTSVALRRLLREPGALPWSAWKAAYASRLLRIEALRTVDRLRLQGRLDDAQVVQVRKAIQELHESLHIVALDEGILQRAGEPFPISLGTLDALHLATAVALREEVALDVFLTHDRALALAAESLGFAVDGV
jgi:predicted nucleic acid-binding protein